MEHCPDNLFILEIQHKYPKVSNQYAQDVKDSLHNLWTILQTTYLVIFGSSKYLT